MSRRRRMSALLPMALLTLMLLPGGSRAGDRDEAMALLPAAEEVPGWSLEEPAVHHPGQEMWQAVNGDAQFYLSYGALALTTVAYRSEGGRIELELFRLPDRSSAFGVFAAQRPEEAADLDLGVQAYRAGGLLALWTDRWYARLKAERTEAVPETALEMLARRLVDRQGEPGGLPADLTAFPEEHRIPHSLGYEPGGTLGTEALSGAFTAGYQAEGKPASVHLVRRSTRAEARGSLESFQAEIARRCAEPPVPLKLGGAKGFRGDTRYHGKVLALLKGADLVVVASYHDEAWAREIAVKVLKAL